MAALSTIMAEHTGVDPDRAGRPALRRLRYLGSQAADPRETDDPLGLLLVEGRLLARVAGAVDLRPRLRRLAAQMQVEGIRTQIVVVDLYAGDEHRDGEVVLALRSFLRAVRASYPRLAGVTLIGRFPHATILRRWPWAPGFADQVNGVATGGRVYLAWEPEFVAASADLVLADLTGGWSTLYRRTITLPSLRLLPPAGTDVQSWLTDGGRVTSDGGAWEFSEHDYEDVFFIDDGGVVLGKRIAGQPLKALIDGFRSDPEVARASLSARNPIALPELAVSRLDASHAAVQLPTDHNRAGTTGRLLDGAPLDASGRPRTFRSTVPYTTRPAGSDAVIADEEFEPDPVLERELLAHYLDRNHAHRTGAFAATSPLGYAVTHSFPPQSDADLLARAIPGIRVSARDASLAGYARSWRVEALVRAITAHSFSRGSAFGTTSAAVIADALGPRPFRWVAETIRPGQFRYTPRAVPSSLATTEDPNAVSAELWVYRTLYTNKRTSARPALVLHGGCGVSTPSGVETLRFTHPDFGRFQNAESLLLYTGSLAMIARSKVFNDSPEDFVAELAGGRRRIGQAWQRMFRRGRDNDPEGSNPGEVAARCKKVYPWNLLGDWSVRLLS